MAREFDEDIVDYDDMTDEEIEMFSAGADSRVMSKARNSAPRKQLKKFKNYRAGDSKGRFK